MLHGILNQIHDGMVFAEKIPHNMKYSFRP